MFRENPILTYTNTLFYPLAPREEEVKLEDIAHALSQMCRANGHFKTFYSVAQHCINCAKEAAARELSSKMQLACLLHDASEAYLADVTRPVKYYLADYQNIERRLQHIIFSKFEIGVLNAQELKHLADIDNALLAYEFKHLHHRPIFEADYQLLTVPDLSERDVRMVEKEFIILAKEIMRKMAG